MKIFFRRIHLYLGLAVGLVITVTCFTGAILVFETELQHVFFKKRYYVKNENNSTYLVADSIISATQRSLPKAKINGIKIYTDKTRTAEVLLTLLKVEQNKTDKGPVAKTKSKNEGTRLSAFVNPYTGDVIEIYNHKKSFFYVVMDLHRWMLGGDIGKMIVGICTLLFLFILITGIVLWWPKSKNVLRQRLKIKSDAGFKRLNHDYHIVLGFYSAIFLFVFAFTGLAWSFEWFNNAIYTVTNTSMNKPLLPKSILDKSTEKIPVAYALQAVAAINANVYYYNITLPKDSLDSYSVNVLDKNAAHESATDNYFVDAFAGKINGFQKFKDKNAGQKVRSVFKPIHVASIYGLPSKIIGLIICLVGTFFPISGIIMWLNRTRKKRKNKLEDL